MHKSAENESKSANGLLGAAEFESPVSTWCFLALGEKWGEEWLQPTFF